MLRRVPRHFCECFYGYILCWRNTFMLDRDDDDVPRVSPTAVVECVHMTRFFSHRMKRSRRKAKCHEGNWTHIYTSKLLYLFEQCSINDTKKSSSHERFYLFSRSEPFLLGASTDEWIFFYCSSLSVKAHTVDTQKLMLIWLQANVVIKKIKCLFKLPGWFALHSRLLLLRFIHIHCVSLINNNY